ncbi:MAG TPA: choice-of-anchor tandem repeat GloVer-containing protein [Rhizomicrobium sp.]|nr:choice-of-anchor tandem repeat GloVer-containing protein [Rhizomicrobium sp.]
MTVALFGAAQAATFTKLHDFNGTDGVNPLIGLIDPTGNVYGGTSGGPMAVFRWSADGHFTDFGNLGGQFTAGMSRDTDGNVYATDWGGGFYKISTEGALSQVATLNAGVSLGFCNDPAGNFYATNFSQKNVVAVSPGGSVVSSYPLPNTPQNSGVTCDAAGNLYGVTGWVDYGARSTVYQVSTSGVATTLYTFCKKADPSVTLCRNGAGLTGSPVRDIDGNLYGTAEFGGRDGGCLTSDALKASRGVYVGCGTIYELTASRELKVLHRFCAHVDPVTKFCRDGAYPITGIVIGPDGTLYSTTMFGGKFDGGTVWSLRPDGTYKVLHNFCAKANCTDGYFAVSLLMDGSGTLYGTTAEGGKHGDGTLFKIVP